MTLVLTLPMGEQAVTGKQVSFIAPCESHEDLTHISIQGNLYSLVDSIGNPPVANSFTEGAIVSVILNNETSQAFIQNASSTKYLEEQIRQALVPTFTEAKTLEKLNNGENLSILFGKIAKMIADYIELGNSGSSGSTNITVSAQTLGAGSEATAIKTVKHDGTVHITIGVPKGADGKDGNDGTSPTISLSKSGNATLITVTNADGSVYKSTIYDGKDGEDGKDGKDGSGGSGGNIDIEDVINALPKTTSLEFGNWDYGSFTEVLDSGDVVIHNVSFVSGIPVEISGIKISGVV